MLATMLVLGLLTPAAAPPEQDIQISGSAGWGGRAIRGEYAPVLVDLDNRGKKDADLLLSVTWGSTYATQSSNSPALDSLSGRSGPVHMLKVTLPAQSRKRVSLTVLTPDSSQLSIWAFAVQDGRTVARGELLTRLLDPYKQVVAVVGQARPEGLEDPNVELANIRPDELPEEWQGYGALDALVWMDGHANEMRSSAQVDALRTWISAGGTFCVARANTVDLAGTPIADLLPVKLGSSRELPSLGGGRFPAGSAVVLESTVRKGAIRAEASGVPLVVEAARDAGRVTFAAVNPANAPFEGWKGAGPFWKWLLNLPPPAKALPKVDMHPPRAIGSPLLAQHAGRFPDVAAPEIGGLFLLIILYLVVVGPLDYLLLRWLRKLEYTWFTFPAYVVLFTLFILLVGGAFIQRAAHQREISVVDYYPESGFTRHHALSAVLAPADVIYNVEDAEPLSSNFIQINDSGGKTNEVRVLRTPQRVTMNWLLNRNFTGLAMADRCSNATAPLSYTISSQNNDSLTLAVKNGSGEAFAGATLVTPRGVYSVPSLPVGESTTSCARTSGTLGEWVKREGLRNLRTQVDEYGNQFNAYRYNSYNNGAGATEQTLNPEVMKALIGLSFPVPVESLDEILPVTGMSRGLQAHRWLETGGSILLAWPRKTEAVVRFDPKPGRHTSVTLHRYFQGPPP